MTVNDFDHLMNSIKGLSPEQARRLRRQLDEQLDSPTRPAAKTAKQTRGATPKNKLLTADEFNRRLFEAGRIASLPEPALDANDDDPDDAPVPIKGEPLSETIIRERR
jgi:hypothetical protein